MLIPKPSEVPAAKPMNKVPEPAKPLPPKKPFVRKEHLTDRALKNHPGLKELKAALDNRKK